MKLIIDIDEELYEQAIRDKDYHKVTGLNDINEYSLTIANGTPISTEGDLISRSELKKTIKEFEDVRGYSILLYIIDNAPTVEINTNDIEYKAYCKGLDDGKKIARPQGEWIIDGHHIRCNKCNEYICNTDREGNKIPDSFCPNCGSDMRGKTYEND